MIELHQLSKVYQTTRGEITALDRLDLRLEAGRFLAICGHSGSGKSTLLAILGGLCRPTSGKVRIAGTDTLSLSSARLAAFRGQELGFVFQFPSLLANLRAIDNVALPALTTGAASYGHAYEMARAMLGRVGLADRWDALPAELSGGQQRRVSIARALINRPPLVLADEPTSDLDENAQREIYDLLLALHREHRSTLVLVTHDLQLARGADELLYLDHGRSAPKPRMAERLVAAHHGGNDSSIDHVEPAEDADGAEPVVSWSPESGTSLKAVEPAPLGAGFGRFLLDFIVWMMMVVISLWAINLATRTFQRRIVGKRFEAQNAAAELALQTLRADLDNIVLQDDGSYLLSLYLTNRDSQQPMFVMGPSVQAFVQVDRSWQAVNIVPVGRQTGDIVKIESRHDFQFVFRPNVERFDELIKGYLHLRFTNSMIVAQSDQPQGDLFDRTDSYYVYLKSASVSDDIIRRENGWAEATLVPRWIPMKAH
ncbi:MAG TPA: ABC transporter ATP-binding protein [Pirellulales bacterium]|nr:ABC transporter ATP-binding protein [Pirellulales bacterium]